MMNDALMKLINTTITSVNINTAEHFTALTSISDMLNKNPPNLYLRGDITKLLRDDRSYGWYKEGMAEMEAISSYDGLLEYARETGLDIWNVESNEAVLSNRLLVGGMITSVAEDMSKAILVQDFITYYMTTESKHRVLTDKANLFGSVKKKYRDSIATDVQDVLHELVTTLEDILCTYQTNVFSVKSKGYFMRIRVLPDYRVFEYEERLEAEEDEDKRDSMRSKENW